MQVSYVSHFGFIFLISILSFSHFTKFDLWVEGKERHDSKKEKGGKSQQAQITWLCVKDLDYLSASKLPSSHLHHSKLIIVGSNSKWVLLSLNWGLAILGFVWEGLETRLCDIHVIMVNHVCVSIVKYMCWLTLSHYENMYVACVLCWTWVIGDFLCTKTCSWVWVWYCEFSTCMYDEQWEITWVNVLCVCVCFSKFLSIQSLKRVLGVLC